MRLRGKRPWNEQGAAGEWKGPPHPFRPLVYPPRWNKGAREGVGPFPSHLPPCSNPSNQTCHLIIETSVGEAPDEAGRLPGAEFSQLESAEAALALVRRGWDAFNKLAAMPFPTVALVRGFCMGGGLELALACRYRVAVDEPGTRFA